MLSASDIQDMEDKASGRSLPEHVAVMSLRLSEWCVIRPVYSQDGTAVQLQFRFGKQHHIPDFVREVHEKIIKGE